jgi:hypothetical protein
MIQPTPRVLALMESFKVCRIWTYYPLIAVFVKTVWVKALCCPVNPRFAIAQNKVKHQHPRDNKILRVQNQNPDFHV